MSATAFCDDQSHVLVADVIKSFDTVDRFILDCALGRHGLPRWFRKVYLAYHSQVRLRFALAAGLGDPWCRDEGIPQGCPLNEIFTLVGPQLYADNLKCSSVCSRALHGAARFNVQYVRAVGQNVSPAKCVQLSTSKSVRRSMKLWDVSGDGRPWSVELDVRDLGCHLDFTRRSSGLVHYLCYACGCCGRCAAFMV